jgi:flavorubredoxin
VAYVLLIFNPFYPCIHSLGDSSVSEFAIPNFHLHRWFKRPKKVEKSGSETSARKIQMPGNHPKEKIQHSEHGESLKLGDSSVSEFVMPNFHLHRLFKRPKKVENIVSETSAHKIQTPENHPKERIQHSEHGESLQLGDSSVSECPSS